MFARIVAASMIAMALVSATPAFAQGENMSPASTELSPALEQLRYVIGDWDVETSFLNADGSVGSSHEGSYSFSWVVENAVVQGISDIPELGLRSGILFYLRPSTEEIEMIAVGRDGFPWVMTGPVDSEIRETTDREMSDGTTLRLRFTRFNVMPDSFESRMERSPDGGRTWIPTNRQTFTRREGD